jgi:hypothetical protein
LKISHKKPVKYQSCRKASIPVLYRLHVENIYSGKAAADFNTGIVKTSRIKAAADFNTGTVKTSRKNAAAEFSTSTVRTSRKKTLQQISKIPGTGTVKTSCKKHCSRFLKYRVP